MVNMAYIFKKRTELALNRSQYVVYTFICHKIINQEYRDDIPLNYQKEQKIPDILAYTEMILI